MSKKVPAEKVQIRCYKRNNTHKIVYIFKVKYRTATGCGAIEYKREQAR